jgi:hypothetical protein
MAALSWRGALARYRTPRRLVTRARRAPFEVVSVGDALIGLIRRVALRLVVDRSALTGEEKPRPPPTGALLPIDVLLAGSGRW